jgi:hypothetical protein
VRNTDLHSDSIKRYPDQAELLKRWATDGALDAFAELQSWAATVPALRVNTAPGPVFSYGSGALANRRLFELRLQVCYGGDMTEALKVAVANRECAGEIAVITAILADQAGIPAVCLLTEKRAEGVFFTLPRVAATLFADNLAKLLSKGSYKVWYKWALLSVVPWEQSMTASKDGKVIWLARSERAVLTVRTGLDGKKMSAAVKVAKTTAAIETLWTKSIAAVAKKDAVELRDGMPQVPDLTLPSAAEIDLPKAMGSARRDQLIRGLPVQAQDRWPIFSSIHPNHAVVMAFELMCAGADVGEATDDNKKVLGQLRRSLLPGHFETLCEKVWEGDVEARIREFDLD